MARINLLPWRETLKLQQQKELGIILGIAVVFTIGIMGLVHMQVASMIDFQDQKNSYLKQEIKAVAKKIKEIKKLEAEKARLLSRMKVIQELQKSRPQIVHLFDEVIEIVPTNTFMESLKQVNNKIYLVGRSNSNAGVSSLMRSVEASGWLGNPQLDVIKTQSSKNDDGADNRFSMVIEQITRKEDD